MVSRRLGSLFVVAALACGGGDDAPGGTEAGSTDAGSQGSGATTSGASTSDVTTGESTGTSSDPTSSDATTSSGTSDGTGDETSGSGSTGDAFSCGTDFPQWQSGTSCPEATAIQIHRYGPNTYILRQSLCTSFEGPFMFMVFGQDRVLIEDTGDGGIPIATAVQGVIDDWLEQNGKTDIELVIVNSHGHGDHVQGNAALAALAGATEVGYTVGELQSFFGIATWPTDTATYDLGGRELQIVPIPGHQSAHIAIYDPEERLLLTGDTLYPGRLYIGDFAAFQASIDRLVAHVEMSTVAGDDYDFGAAEHPNEHPLQLERDHLLELQSAIAAMGAPTIEVHDDFIIYPLE
jgi:glyoxylase-like metal-dependent hydrolase (beta-lactamase superfamily II)